MRAFNTPTHPLRLRGFYLLEVLVAALILSVGMIGIAGLQLTSKRSNFEATQRTTASLLVQELIERMRGNPDQLATYTSGGVGRTLTGATMGVVDCSGGCNTIQIAQFDLYQWEQALSGVAEQNTGGVNVGGLTAPTACVTGPNGGSGTYTVAVAWRGLTKLSNPAAHACGQGSGLYDSDTEADVYRRLLVVETFIAEPF